LTGAFVAEDRHGRHTDGPGPRSPRPNVTLCDWHFPGSRAPSRRSGRQLHRQQGCLTRSRTGVSARCGLLLPVMVSLVGAVGAVYRWSCRRGGSS